MRTQKRFTPALLERFERLGRGKGVYGNYVPWHRVSRSDPSSIGTSHCPVWLGRHMELLSTLERITFYFSTMATGVIDIRDQFPLSTESSAHELCAYEDGHCATELFAGTIEIADELKITHPLVRGDGRTAHWVMTTDLLVTIKTPTAKQLLAIAVKPKGAIVDPRTKEKLSLERAYWMKRGVEWILITPELYEELVADTLMNTSAWALDEKCDDNQLQFVAANHSKLSGKSLTSALNILVQEFQDMDVAQRALWQTIWSGLMPMDLRRGWRPHLLLSLLEPSLFCALNPVESRRSAWAS